MFDNTLAFGLKLLDTPREHVRSQAFHDPATAAQKMGMIRVMARLSHAIPEGPISRRKSFNQALVYQEVKDAIKGDLVNRHLVSNGCLDLGHRERPWFLPDWPENRLTKRGRIHTMTFQHLSVVTTLTHAFYNNAYATELQAKKSYPTLPSPLAQTLDNRLDKSIWGPSVVSQKYLP
jgi:hypothetical protein